MDGDGPPQRACKAQSWWQRWASVKQKSRQNVESVAGARSNAFTLGSCGRQRFGVLDLPAGSFQVIGGIPQQSHVGRAAGEPGEAGFQALQLFFSQVLQIEQLVAWALSLTRISSSILRWNAFVSRF